MQTFISDSWLGERLFSQHKYHDPRVVRATAVHLAGPDNVIRDVVVFSAQIGVHVAAEANFLTGVHVWNMGATAGGIG